MPLTGLVMFKCVDLSTSYSVSKTNEPVRGKADQSTLLFEWAAEVGVSRRWHIQADRDVSMHTSCHCRNCLLCLTTADWAELYLRSHPTFPLEYRYRGITLDSKAWISQSGPVCSDCSLSVSWSCLKLNASLLKKAIKIRRMIKKNGIKTTEEMKKNEEEGGDERPE